MDKSVVNAIRELEAHIAFDYLEKNKSLINDALIAFEKGLADHGVAHPTRAATLAFYLTEIMFRFVTSIACCEESYKKKMDSLAETLRAEALKRGNDLEQYRVVMRAMGKEIRVACTGEPAKAILLN